MTSEENRHTLPPSLLWNSRWGSDSTPLATISVSGFGSDSVGTKSKGQQQQQSQRLTITASAQEKRAQKFADCLIPCLLPSVFMAAFGIMMFSIVEGIIQVWKFHHLTGQEFYDDNLRAVLLMKKNHFPIVLVTAFLLSFATCTIAMIYALKFGDRKLQECVTARRFFAIYMTWSRWLILLLTMCLGIQFWAYMNHFPNANHVEGTKLQMQLDMYSANGRPSESLKWDATQKSFDCCGIACPRDWLRWTLAKNPKAEKNLPLSCCVYHWSTNVTDEDYERDPKAALRKISDALSQSPKCLFENARPSGCNAKILMEINLTGLRTLVDYGILLSFHILLTLTLDFIATLKDFK